MSWLFDGIATLAVEALNAVIAALGAAVAAVLGLLPSMPSMPSLPDRMVQVLGWVNWFFPVGTVVDILTFLVGAWTVWLVVRVLLSWAKVVAE